MATKTPTRPRTPEAAKPVHTSADQTAADHDLPTNVPHGPLLPEPDGSNDDADSESATLQAEVAPASPSPSPVPVPHVTKAALIRAMLDAPGGASLARIMAATGWQAHTVRAALSGLRKARMTLAREKVDGETVYRIVRGVPEAAPAETGTDVTAPSGSRTDADETEVPA